MRVITHNLLFAFNIIALNSVDFYNCIDHSKYVSIFPGTCPEIEYNHVPQWIKHNIKAHNTLAKLKPMLRTYDFIVVGAGAAGSVIASRLSEDPFVSVLLIEAGGVEDANTDTPGAMTSLMGTRYDWNFVIEPQINGTFIYSGGRIVYNRGKALGGSSVTNGLVYFRGDPKDFDNWEKLGAHEWSWKHVFPYFLRSEGNTDPKYAYSHYHNSCGPLTVTSNSENSPFLSAKYTVDACKELGFPQIDANGATRIGTGYVQQPIVNGTRFSISKAFLEPIYENRPNLHIMTNAYVTKVIISKNKTAVGVVYDRFNRTYTVNAKLEVILSAGVINSPQILLLSGIGSEIHLNRFKISVVADLPGVGKNFRDHVYVAVLNPIFLFPNTGNLKESCAEYLANRSGALAHLDVSFCNANSSINTDTDWNDIQILSANITVLLQNLIPENYTAFTLNVGVVRPKSVGYLELRSNDPFDQPLIQPNYLTHSHDMIALIDGLRLIFRIAQTNSFNGFGNQAFDNIAVDCETKFSLINDAKYPNMKVPNDEYLECLARHMTIPGVHGVGTCKMGSPLDKWSVVDPRLNVLGGIRNLRVADASVMPRVTNANTFIPSVMIGERVAQFIKDDYDLI